MLPSMCFFHSYEVMKAWCVSTWMIYWCVFSIAGHRSGERPCVKTGGGRMLDWMKRILGFSSGTLKKERRQRAWEMHVIFCCRGGCRGFFLLHFRKVEGGGWKGKWMMMPSYIALILYVDLYILDKCVWAACCLCNPFIGFSSRVTLIHCFGARTWGQRGSMAPWPA